MEYVNEVYLFDPPSSFKPADRCFQARQLRLAENIVEGERLLEQCLAAEPGHALMVSLNDSGDVHELTKSSAARVRAHHGLPVDVESTESL